MIVRDIMKTDVATCAPHDDVAMAANIMRDRKCGFVPVVDSHGLVLGVVTDRDLCLALAAQRQRTADRVAIRDTMSHPVVSCFADENVKVSLGTMAKRRVRRLPVIDRQGHLQGVLSIDDVILAPRRRGAPTADDIVDALRAIDSPKPLETVGA
jgi:CBS domain-containing protein